MSFGRRGFEQDGRGLRGLKFALALAGVALVVLSLLLPISMGAVARRGAAGATFQSGYLRSLTPIITTASMASSLIAAAVILSFEKSKANAAAIVFGILTVSVFTAEILLSLYLSLVRPLTATIQLVVYVLIGLVPLGLGCTLFTLASIMSAR